MDELMRDLPENLREQMLALMNYAKTHRPCVYCGERITLSPNPELISFWVFNAVWTVTQGRPEVVPLCYECLTRLKLNQLDLDELALKLLRDTNS